MSFDFMPKVVGVSPASELQIINFTNIVAKLKVMYECDDTDLAFLNKVSSSLSSGQHNIALTSDENGKLSQAYVFAEVGKHALVIAEYSKAMLSSEIFQDVPSELVDYIVLGIENNGSKEPTYIEAISSTEEQIGNAIAQDLAEPMTAQEIANELEVASLIKALICPAPEEVQMVA